MLGASPERMRTAGMAALAFCLIATYELARPASESIFLETYGPEALPYAWLAVPVVAALAVALYNRFAGRMHLLRLLAAASLISAAVLATLGIALFADVPGASFCLYVVKDVYIVVLIEIFWSHANVVYRERAARWVYGLFLAMGSAGGATADLVAASFAEGIGTLRVMLLAVPLLCAIGAACSLWARGRTAPGEDTPASERGPRPGLLEGARVIRASRYLASMLVMICLVQVVITLVDYRFNVAVNDAYPAQDERTKMIGGVYLAINVAAIVLQLTTGAILKLAGVARALIGIPALLGGTLLLSFLVPGFALLALAKVMSKCLDYSVFRAAKEILYIPLDYVEKTRGKAMVDMLSYRVAKGAASLIVLALAGTQLEGVVSSVTFVLIAGWLGLAIVIGRLYRGRAEL